jgi:hypothetical protein
MKHSIETMKSDKGMSIIPDETIQPAAGLIANRTAARLTGWMERATLLEPE